jgi:hypothetical protein
MPAVAQHGVNIAAHKEKLLPRICRITSSGKKYRERSDQCEPNSKPFVQLF